jgi:hypothetical protein
VYLTLKIEGVGGEPPEKLDVEPKIPGVRVFADEPVVKVHYDDSGAHYEATFAYALMAEGDFTVPPVRIAAFSYTQKRLYELATKPMRVTVAPVPASTLVDKETSPESVYETIESLKRWALDLFIFACGFVSALLFVRVRKMWAARSGGDAFRKEVRRARDAKTLLNLLIRTDPLRYAAFIDDLEGAVYKGRKVNLSQIKKGVSALRIRSEKSL